LFEGQWIRDAQIVHENIRRSSEGLKYVLDRRLDSNGGTEVGSKRSVPRIPPLVESDGVLIRNDHAGSFASQGVRDRRADSVCASSYETELTFELIIHRIARPQAADSFSSAPEAVK
jgi:hypothetical protein